MKSLVSPIKTKPLVTWSKSSLSFKNDELGVDVDRLGRSDSSLLAELQIRSDTNATLDPSAIWLTQGTKTVPIQRLVLSSLKISGGDRVKAIVEVLKDDLDQSKSVSLEVRRKSSSKVTLPRPISW